MTSSPSPVKPSPIPASSGPTPYRLPDAAADRAFARNMGIDFRDPLLLRLALTHRSVLHDWLNIENIDATLQSNERLEFLGDALLGVVVGEFLYRADPIADEGTLTRRRAAIVRAETLVLWSRELELSSHLYLGTGESVTQSVRDRMLAGGFEALVGAVYLDRGRDLAESFVMGFLQRDGARILANEEQTNPKGTLQEVMQERFGSPPEYETLVAEGPDHARQFTVAVVLNGEHIGIGRGRSKREAQQSAAAKALVGLGVAIEPGIVTRSEAKRVLPEQVSTDIDIRQDTTVRLLKERHVLRMAGGTGVSRISRRLRGSGKREG